MILVLHSDITRTLRPTTMNSKSPTSDSKVDSLSDASAVAVASAAAVLPAAAGRDDAIPSEGEGSDVETSPQAGSQRNLPTGLILKSGRVRLPDKLMEFLNKKVSESLYWMPEGESFAIDAGKAQVDFLDKFFSGTKLSSFLRSISRWGFKRVFYHTLDKNVYAFHHPLFNSKNPHMEKDMKMIVAESRSKKAKKASTQVAPEEKGEFALPSASVANAAVASSNHHSSERRQLAGNPLSPSQVMSQSMLHQLLAGGQQPIAGGGTLGGGGSNHSSQAQRLTQLVAAQRLAQARPAPPTNPQPLLVSSVRILQQPSADDTSRSSPTIQQALQRAFARQQLQDQLQQQLRQQQLQQQQSWIDFLASLQRRAP